MLCAQNNNPIGELTNEKNNTLNKKSFSDETNCVIL